MIVAAGSTSSTEMGAKPVDSSRQSRSTAGGASLKCCINASYASASALLPLPRPIDLCSSLAIVWLLLWNSPFALDWMKP